MGERNGRRRPRRRRRRSRWESRDGGGEIDGGSTRQTADRVPENINDVLQRGVCASGRGVLRPTDEMLTVWNPLHTEPLVESFYVFFSPSDRWEHCRRKDGSTTVSGLPL